MFDRFKPQSKPNGRTQPGDVIETDIMPPENEIKFSTRAKVWTIVIFVGIALALVFRVGEVLPPFIWALVTAFVFNDLLTALTKRTGRPRWLWVTVVFLAFFAIIGVLLFTVVPSTSRQLEAFAKDVPKLRADLDKQLSENDTLNVGGISVSSATVRTGMTNFLDKVPETVNSIGPELLRGTFHIAIDYVVYLIATLYLMLMGSKPVFNFINTLPLSFRGEIRALVIRIDTVLGAYIKGQFLLIGIMSVASFVVLTVMQVRYSLVLAIMVGVLELVPFIGPYLAISICCAVTFFQPEHAYGLPTVIAVIIVGVALFVLRQLEDYLIIPTIIGHIVELHPLLVIFTVVAAAALLGPMGLLLGVPMVAAFKIIVGYLYYKLVDADREKIVLPTSATFDDLMALLAQKANKRLLIGITKAATFLEDPENLRPLQQFCIAHQIDLAFNCGDEELTRKLRDFGFTVIEMTQEHIVAHPEAVHHYAEL